MATRQLRKLRKRQELLSLQNEAAEESDDEPIVERPRGSKFAGFAALGDMGGDDDEDEEERNEEEEEQMPAEKPVEQAVPAKKSKKSKKKKKKKAKQTGSPAATEEQPQGDVDEIDRVLEELKLEAQQKGAEIPGAIPAADPTEKINQLLSINFQHLKAANEMRRLFGKAMDVAESEERTEQARQQRTLPQNVDLETFLSIRGQQGYYAPGRQAKQGMFETVLRTNPFIEGKRTWPRGSALGLKMIRIEGGNNEFSFAHDKTYDELEASFFGLVQMYDPMQIVYFLHRYPYHVSSLIQCSKVARQDQNEALAADLIERALFTFGRVSLSEFRKKLEKGQARMSFYRPENRQFYLAGFNLIQKLALKGTYRTALEWAKLLLSINHDDPYGIANVLHVLAIRAREADWFIDLCKSGLLDAPFTGCYTKHTEPLAYLQLGDEDTAKSILTRNIESYPWLYCSLFSELNLDAPRSIWGIQPRNEDESLYTRLYIHTAKDLWNTKPAIALLKSAAASANPPSSISSLPSSPPISLPTARFIYLDNTPSLMALLPPSILHSPDTPNFDFDPLPPPREQNIFSSPAQHLPWAEYGATITNSTTLDDIEELPESRRQEVYRQIENTPRADRVRQMAERAMAEFNLGGQLARLWPREREILARNMRRRGDQRLRLGQPEAAIVFWEVAREVERFGGEQQAPREGREAGAREAEQSRAEAAPAEETGTRAESEEAQEQQQARTRWEQWIEPLVDLIVPRPAPTENRGLPADVMMGVPGAWVEDWDDDFEGVDEFEGEDDFYGEYDGEEQEEEEQNRGR